MENFRNGDVGLLSVKFRFSIPGLLQMLIRIHQNMPYLFTFQWHKISIYHHVFSIVEKNGDLRVYEAIAEGYVDTGSIYDHKYILEPNKYKYCIRRLKDEYTNLDFDAYQKVQNDMLGLKYWYGGTLGWQWLKQVTFDLIWLGGNSLTHVYCSMAGAKGLNALTSGKLFKRYFAEDPQGLFVSKYLTTTNK